MSEITIVMPTLWMVKEITDTLLREAEEHGVVKEIIICNNGKREGGDLTGAKIKNIHPPEPMFVFPAINMMMEHVTTDLVCILSDDVQTYQGFWDDMLAITEAHWDDFGVIGVGQTSLREVKSHYPPHLADQDFAKNFINDFHDTTMKKIHGGWCCLMMMRKDRYVPVPNELKMWAGDTFLTYLLWSQGYNHYLIEGRDIVHHASHTSQHFMNQWPDAQVYFNNWVQKELWDKGHSKTRFPKA